ncbi:MAG TPA: YkgJ family cysteine cluster protein [Methanocella sp.]|nr:YkgJ family cysteine cluster protein [Methanocella sp.]
MSEKKRAGSCKRCGNCCRDFIIDVKVPDVTDFEFTDYLRWINCHRGVRAGVKNFKERTIEIQIKNSCKYLTENADGTYFCAINDDKPGICKRYPEEDYSDEISRKCGYQFVDCFERPSY